MDQLKFEDFPQPRGDKAFQKEREKILSTGEKILLFKIEEIKSNSEITEIHIIFKIEKPDGVIVEKTFIFDFKNPEKKPKIKSRILSAPAGSRVFYSEEALKDAGTISYTAFQEIKKQAYAIFKDRLKRTQK
jgi:hypothetical protein